MNDNILALLDMRQFDPSVEALSVEGALMKGDSPFTPLKDLTHGQARHQVRVARLVREYIIDHDLPRACARAGVPWDLGKTAERDPLFITLLRMMMEELRPEEVVTRTEVLMLLKREATTASKAADRINAINHLARLAGMELREDNGKGGAPTINITLNGGAAAPAIDVTPAKPRLTVGGEELL